MPAATRKIVINRCCGGFQLSPAGLSRYAELSGRPIYFFTMNFGGGLKFGPPISLAAASGAIIYHAFDIPNPDEVLGQAMAIGPNKYGRALRKHHISCHDIDRADAKLVQVIEELGKQAEGKGAELCVVTVPADIKWTITERNGVETVEETHRCWP